MTQSENRLALISPVTLGFKFGKIYSVYFPFSVTLVQLFKNFLKSSHDSLVHRAIQG